ncbi:ABC transporter substrate-binding protein [Treponema pedis]|uniref:ABC transporter substrate-binding protein n=1 Tax=Treponema pedis TaxID=409322 RepID=UPI003133E068
MNTKKKIFRFMFLLSAAVIFLNCTKKEEMQNAGDSMQPAGGAYPVTITTYNYAGEPIELTFEKAPEKVIAFYQSPIETMLALGLADKLILAVGLDDPVKEEFKEDFGKVNYKDKRPSKEEVIDMEPDFIFGWSSLFNEKRYGDVNFWHERGTKTYIWQDSGLKKQESVENECQDILNIGKIFNVEQKAQDIVDKMKAEIEAAKKYVEGKKKVRAIIIEVEKEGQYRVYGAKTIGGDIAIQVGAELVGTDKGYIGKEELIELNPEVIFSVYYGDAIIKEQAVDMLIKDEALKSISALENKKVLPITLSEVYASGIRTYDGIKTIIAGLYPEL